MKFCTAVIITLTSLFSTGAWAGSEGMRNMPKIASKKVYTIESKESGEDLQDGRGFGAKEPMVRMMNLMMVGGSGFEGMDMSMEIAANEEKLDPPSAKATSSFEYELSIPSKKPKVGVNTVTVLIRDSKTKKSRPGLKLKAQVYMTSMDMGTDEPRVREVAPGKYQIEATFAMKGPWALKLILPNDEKIFDFNVQ